MNIKMNVEALADQIISIYKTWTIPLIYWQTATGKTRLSLELAKRFPIEVISADSRQIYRYMDIGTDKVSQVIRSQIIHHQIDIVDPDQIYTAGQRQVDTYKIIEEVFKRWKIPVIVGGTGLYIDTVVYNFTMGIVEPNPVLRKELEEKETRKPGILWDTLHTIDPVEAAKHHPSSIRFIIRALEIYYQTWALKSDIMKRQKPNYPLLMVGLRQDVKMGNKLIDERLELMIQDGLIQEVQDLLDKWYDPKSNALQSIDYKQTIDYLEKLKIEQPSAFSLLHSAYMASLQIANHQLAKKQRTRFRRYSRDNEYHNGRDDQNNIRYLDLYLPDYI